MNIGPLIKTVRDTKNVVLSHHSTKSFAEDTLFNDYPLHYNNVIHISMDTAASIEDELAPIPQVELSESCKCLGDQ